MLTGCLEVSSGAKLHSGSKDIVQVTYLLLSGMLKTRGREMRKHSSLHSGGAQSSWEDRGHRPSSRWGVGRDSDRG